MSVLSKDLQFMDHQFPWHTARSGKTRELRNRQLEDPAKRLLVHGFNSTSVRA